MKNERNFVLVDTLTHSKFLNDTFPLFFDYFSKNENSEYKLFHVPLLIFLTFYTFIIVNLLHAVYPRMSIRVSSSYNITLRIDTVLGSINCNFVSYYLMHIAFKMSPTIYNFDLSLNSSFYGLLVSGRIKNFTKDCILFVKNKMRSHGD